VEFVVEIGHKRNFRRLLMKHILMYATVLKFKPIPDKFNIVGMLLT